MPKCDEFYTLTTINFTINLNNHVRCMQQLNEIFERILLISSNELEQDIQMEQVSGWDSLKHMELITSIENTFQIQLTMEEIAGMRSTGVIKEILMSKIG